MKSRILPIFFILITGVIGTSFVSAIDISLDNYYPSPVEAGDYFNLWLTVSNKGNSDAEGARVKLDPSYPFSLDPGEDEVNTIATLEGGSVATVKMKVRVDSAAKEGDNKIVFQYSDCAGCEWKEKSFSVVVMEAQTTFDVVLQELSEEGVYFAIANIGKNTANAVTVRIPEQDNFDTDLISASIVGNLESGDYTIVGFQLVPKGTQEKSTEEGSWIPGNRQNEETGEKELLIQIDYTDPLGGRRSVYQSIMINPSSLTQVSLSDSSTVQNMRSKGNSSLFSNIWFWGFILLLGFVVGKKIYLKKKQKK